MNGESVHRGNPFGGFLQKWIDELETTYLPFGDVLFPRLKDRSNVLFPADSIEEDETFSTQESIRGYVKRVMDWANARKWEVLTALVFAQSSATTSPINETHLDINWKRGKGVEPILEFCMNNRENNDIHFQFDDSESRMLERYPELPEVDEGALVGLDVWAERYWNKIDRDGIREWVESIWGRMRSCRGRGYEESAVRTALRRIGHFDQK